MNFWLGPMLILGTMSWVFIIRLDWWGLLVHALLSSVLLLFLAWDRNNRNKGDGE